MKLVNIGKIVANITTLIFGITLVGGNIALANEGAITGFLGQSNQVREDNGGDGENIYYFSDYTSISDLQDDAKEVSSRTTQEGAVLLKNKGNALPLTNDAKINLYSSSSVNFIHSGGGSSYAKNSEYVSLKDGLTNNGFKVNEDLYSWYANNKQYFNNHTSSTSSDAAHYEIRDAKWDQIDKNAREKEAEAGIFVLSRYGTEASDLKFANSSGTGYTNGNYLELSPSEKDVLKNLKALKAAKKISKIVVLLNSVNQVQCDYIDDPEYDIDAVLWVGIGGSNATDGIAKVLNGTANPSGKLTDTYYKKHYFNPVYANFGNYKNQGTVISTANSGKSNSYVVYQEGIYNGYRYTETRYEDTILKDKSNVGTFNYKDVVSYPFGYGLSYTTFSYSDFKAIKNDDDTYELSVKVTNTGKIAGKEGVDFYIQKPYTTYDVTNGIEKSAVDLVQYTKTSLLKPGDTETVSVKVNGDVFASYDSHNAKTYVVDAGDYYFAVGKDAHDATNNILNAKGKTKSDGMDGSGNGSLVKKFTKDFDDKTYSVSKETEKPITNQFDNADLNLYKNKGENKVNYISRSNWDGTVKLGISSSNALLNNQVIVKTNENMKKDGEKLSQNIQKDDTPYPIYGTDNDMTLASMLSMDKTGKLYFTDYNDPKWDKLLDQLTFEDTSYLLAQGLRKTAGVDSVNKPETIDGNGAMGPVLSYDNNDTSALYRFAFLYGDSDSDSSPIMYPTPSLLAASRNKELGEEVGTMVGEDCLWAGYSGLYGLGVNIHRGTYNGRAFEYASEDGVLAGYTAASEVKGIHKSGVYVYMKHAVLNDQEKNREGVNTWCNEQTIREIYLKPFEIAIKEADAENVMTGFNRIGTIWTSQQGFINTVLRDEFNMSGFAVSDYYQGGYMDSVGGVMGGCALLDGDIDNTKPFAKFKEGYGKVAQAMREEAHRILYTVAKSNAMNGMDVNTVFRTVTPPWVIALNSVCITCDVLFALGVAFYAFSITYEESDKFKSLIDNKIFKKGKNN